MLNIPSTRRNAFSLVELSIVLVILGLLVGGILSGRSLIRASELRSIATESDKFASAIFAFRDKYFALPGDMPNAYQFWGATCGTNTTTPSTGCNGDGDSRIAVDIGGEDIKTWEHLARAGLIEGSYDGVGVDDGSGYMVLAPNNSPKSKFPQHYWGVNASDFMGAANVRLSIATGSITAGNAMIDFSTSLTRGESYNFDRKIDDGISGSGKVRGDARDDCNESTGRGNYGADLTLGGDPDMKDCSFTFVLN